MPILHAKLLLLGVLTWQEDEEYGSGEFLKFKPERLWVGSANGTRSSRSSLEFGCWLEDRKLLESTRRFLAEVIRHSESFDPDSDDMAPELVDPDFDDVAMAEAAAPWNGQTNCDWSWSTRAGRPLASRPVRQTAASKYSSNF